MKKALKWLGIVVLTPIVLLLLVMVLIYLPPVQDYAVPRLCAYASEKTGMDISVQQFRLKFPLDLHIEGVAVKDTTEFFAELDSATVSVQFMPLLDLNVVLNEFNMQGIRMNTAEMIDAVRLKGEVKAIGLANNPRFRDFENSKFRELENPFVAAIALNDELADVGVLNLDGADLDIVIPDSVPEDTTKSEPTKWKINALCANINQSKFRLHTSTMDADANLERAAAEEIRVDLGTGKYDVGSFSIGTPTMKQSSLAYRQPAPDSLSVALDSLLLRIDSISYADPMNVKCNIQQFASTIALNMPSSAIDSKLRIDNFAANIELDSTQVRVPYFSLLTPNTNLKGSTTMDLNAFDKDNPGTLKATVDGVVGRKDIEQFVDLKALGVTLPATISANADVEMSGPRLKTRLKTRIDNARIAADVDMNLNTMAYNLTADVDNMNVARYMPDLGVGLFSGKITAKGNGFDIAHDKIDAKIDVHRLQYGGYDLRNVTLEGDLSKGLAGVKLKIRDPYLDADITMNGNIATLMEMDMSRPNLKQINGDLTAVIRRADLYHLNIIDHPLTITSVNADAVVKNGFVNSLVKSRNDMLWGDVSIDGMLNPKDFNATIVADVTKLDLKKMGFAEDRMVTGFCGNLDFYTDLGDNIRVQGILSDLALDDSTGYFLPLDAELDIMSNRDTTYANVNATSLALNLEAKGGYMKLADSFSTLAEELTKQIGDKEIDEAKLKQLYPDIKLRLRMDEQAPVMYLIEQMGYSFEDLNVDLSTRNGIGLNGYAEINKFKMDSTQVDRAKMKFASDAETTKFKVDVQNDKDNPQIVFHALVDGEVVTNGANIDVKLYDAKDVLGIRLGADALLNKDSLLVKLTPENPVLGYKEYHLNKDNYLCLHEKNRITTDIQLVAKDGTGLKIYSMPNDNALQDLSLSINHFDLTELTAIMPYFPKITGYLEGDMHYVQKDEEMTIASDIGISNMTYEECRLGDINTEFVLMPDLSAGGESFLDGNLMKDGREIATISGKYRSDNAETKEDEAYISASLDLENLPLEIVNGFIPDQIIGFIGNGDGTLSVEGPMNKLDVNGEVYLDSAYLISVPYGVNLRFDNDPVRIVNSKLLLENFSLYAHNENPLVIHGNVDFSNMDNMSMDLQMRGKDFEAVSAKKTRRSVAYGNAFLDIYATMKGPMNNLSMRGMINLLAKTNLTYVLEDSPLNTDDRMKGLITFKNFRDTTTVVEVEKPQISGFNMDLTLKVEDGAQIMCNLNADGTNYIDLEGGGDLRMKYNNTDDLTLTGKYTLNRGEMKYSLPVIPLKTFAIQKGSYVEFMGDVMNPKLNITATETTQAAVSNYGEDRHTVKFNCGVKVTKTLQDMGLQFILEAPEDMTVQNELDGMGEAQVGKLAVAMLTSGIYMAESNTSSISMNDALNSFLQGQISNIAGDALKTIDVSMGMSNVADASGASYTDYSFSFAKRFWNNRVSVAVGGRYSSAGGAGHNSEAALDNVSLEYRLDSSASKLLRLNYQRNKMDNIEGYVSEYSGGIMLKKKMNALKELFNFSNKTTTKQPLAR